MQIRPAYSQEQTGFILEFPIVICGSPEWISAKMVIRQSSCRSRNFMASAKFRQQRRKEFEHGRV